MSKCDMVSSVEVITPEAAGAMLASNHSNRPIHRTTVANYAREMREGRWRLTHEGIALASDGRLLDGQHRLSAVVASGVTITSLVTRNVPSDLFDVLGRGRPRTIGDTLALAGYPQGHTLGAAIRIVRNWERGRIGAGNVVSAAEALECAKRHPLLPGFLSRARSDLAPQSVFASLKYIASLHDRDAAEAFFSSVQTGSGVSAGDPAFALRSRLIHDLACRSKLPARAVIAMFVKSWRKQVMGERAALVKWSEKEGDPEMIPSASAAGFSKP